MSDNDKGNLQKVGEGMGGLAGKAADTAVSIMSSMLRTAAGNLGGWWSDRSPEELTSNLGEHEENSFRTHFDNTRKSDSSYDAVRPLYQFGHLAGSNPDYQGRSFEEVESDLKSTWTGDQTSNYGDWDKVRDYISTGYMTRNSRGGNL